MGVEQIGYDIDLVDASDDRVIRDTAEDLFGDSYVVFRCVSRFLELRHLFRH